MPNQNVAIEKSLAEAVQAIALIDQDAFASVLSKLSQFCTTPEQSRPAAPVTPTNAQPSNNRDRLRRSLLQGGAFVGGIGAAGRDYVQSQMASQCG